MGAYAGFIWSAYGFTALAVGALVLHGIRDNRAQKRALARLESDGGGRDE